jgi:hypothetical protein
MGDSEPVKIVFLSSAARGLEEYREAVYHAIERIDGYHCVRMEDFGARELESAEFCSKRAAECDIFVGIVGQRYGSSPPDINGGAIIDHEAPRERRFVAVEK